MALRIHIENCNDSFPCSEGVEVLRAMECLGRKGIPVGCRGGGCGVCKVQVLDGRYHTGTMSRTCVTADEEAQGYALACKVIPDTDLKLRVIGTMARSFEAALGTFQFYGSSFTSRNI